MVSAQGVEANLEKMQAILEWPTPTYIHEVHSFNGLSTFYRQFIRIFSTNMAPIMECTKSGPFMWTQAANCAFEEIKHKMTHAPVLCLPDFDKVVEVACDASHLVIRGFLSWEGHSIALFSKKLNDAPKRHSTYDLEFYALI